jgi:hypothetical protein
VSLASVDSQLLYRNIDEGQGTGELSVDAPLPPAALDNALRMGFEQLALAEICVPLNPSDAEKLRMFEDAGFRRELVGGHFDLVRLRLREQEWRAARGMGPKVALMQPQFLPWLGYLELIHRADVFVFLDDFQFLRRSWGQRNRLFVVRGKVGMVTVPVVHQDNQEATFLDLREVETSVWRRKLLSLLDQNYRGASHGDAVLSIVRDWFEGSYANIADLEIALIEKIAGYLGLHARFVRSSTLGIAGLRRSARLLAILEKLGAGTYISAHGSFPYMKEDGVFPLPNLPVYFQNHIPREYPQYGASEFVPRLSSLDALANLAPDEVRIKLRGTAWWQSWEEREAEEKDLTSPPASPHC